MINEEKLKNIVYEIYQELFNHSEPKADFDVIRKSGESKKPDFFMKYYLSQDEQEKIMNRIMKSHKLSYIAGVSVKNTVNLGCSPNTCKETWLKYKEKR